MRQIIIIGSGPAGYTAAVYAARANLKPLLIASSVEAGGELMNTTEVENFPGFPDGVMGPDLMFKMQAQAEKFGTDIVLDDVVSVDLSGDIKTVTLGSGAVHEALAVIFATGSAYRKLGLEDEERLSGHGVSWCATCDGFFFRERTIAVVGGGDSAMEEAVFLTRFASKVTLVHRRETLRASKIMQDKARKNEKIVWMLDHEVDEIKDTGKGEVTSMVLRSNKTGAKTEIPVHGIFVAIGHTPNTALFRGQLELDQNGYIVTHDGAKTSMPGVFACGDVQDHIYRQAITAAGSGCMAAIDAEHHLDNIPEHLASV